MNNDNKDKPNNLTKITYQKQLLVKDMINKIASEYKNRGLTKRHIDKALKYYLNLDEVKDDSITLDEFQKFLKQIEEQLYNLALNTEKNYIKELEFYNKPKEKEEKDKKDKKDKFLSHHEFTNNNNDLENSKDEENVEEKKEQLKDTKPEVNIKNQKEEFEIDTGKETKTEEESESTLEKESKPQEVIEIAQEDNKQKENEPNKKDSQQENLSSRQKEVISLINEIAKQYEGKGILKSHINKAEDYYLKLLKEYYQDASKEEFESFLKSMECELYILAEDTKNNYINILKRGILENPKISLEEKKQIVDKIYLTKSEKSKIVTRLIDRIANEYSYDGVFDRHVKKAYDIFLNREEVLNNNLSLEDFNKFLIKIEQELYMLAEQTKKNYEYYRNESAKHGKVMRKGEDFH